MRFSEKQLALALYESVKGKNKEEAKKTVHRFLVFLKDHNCLHRADKVLAGFSEIWNSREGILEVLAESARVLDKNTLKELVRYIKDRTKAESVEISNIEKPQILGGFILKYRDVVLDASLKSKIENLKNNIKR